MSVQRGYVNGGHYYSNIAKPIKVACQFTVSVADSGGLGITSLKSNGYVNKVYMHTSATPATGNPNPASGYAWIQMKNNYNVMTGMKYNFQPPGAGSELAVTSGRTAGAVYIISTVGTTTAAEWAAFGLPPGLTPTVGQSFVALTTGTGGSHTGKVKVPGISGIASIEVVGDPNQSIANSSIASNSGAWILVEFLAATSSSVTTLIPTAPTDLTVVSLSLEFDGSSVTIDGL